MIKADSHLTTNQQIIEYGGLDCSDGAVVAIDAPLVVRNATGCRPAERELTDLFWAYYTAPYPANLSNTSFQEGGRKKLFGRLKLGPSTFDTTHCINLGRITT